MAQLAVSRETAGAVSALAILGAAMKSISEGTHIEHAERPWRGKVAWVSPDTDYRPDGFTPPVVALVSVRSGPFAGMVYAEKLELLERPRIKLLAAQALQAVA